MLSFRQLLTEEIEHDAKLLHMALKHHFRDPKNFSALLKTRKSTGMIDRFLGSEYHDHEVKGLVVPKHIATKYPGLKVHLGPLRIHDETRGSAGSVTKNPTYFGLKKKTHTISINTLPSLHPKYDKMSLNQRHKKFMTELNDSQHIFAHETTHLNQLHSNKLEINRSTVSEIKKDYHNHPIEFEAHLNQHTHHLESALLKHPHIRDLLQHHRQQTISRIMSYIPGPFSHGYGGAHLSSIDWLRKLNSSNRQAAETHIRKILRKRLP